MNTMQAAVIRQAGGPEVLKIETLPIPTPKPGEVLIRVKAFGLNRSELFTRQGHSPMCHSRASLASKPQVSWNRRPATNSSPAIS